MTLIMAQDRTSRGVATLAALAVQGLVLLAMGVGLGIVPVPQPDAPAMTVALLPVLKPIVDAPATRSNVHVRLLDPGRPPPVVPVDIVLPQAVPDPTPEAAEALRTTRNESMGATLGSDSAIGIVIRVEPDYPKAAVDRRAQGTTSVAFLVDANGHPGTVRVLHSSGDAQLDEAAVRAVQQWEFNAAMSNSHVVPRWGRLDINFNLTLYRKEHAGAAAAGRRDEPDPVAVLAAVIHNPRSPDLLSAAIRRLLQQSGPVRSIRFMGVSARPPDSVAQEVPQELRMLDSGHVQGWNVFEVTQLRGTSQWYCAVDAAGQIQAIVTSAD
jgi:TonB family protein